MCHAARVAAPGSLAYREQIGTLDAVRHVECTIGGRLGADVTAFATQLLVEQLWHALPVEQEQATGRRNHTAILQCVRGCDVSGDGGSRQEARVQGGHLKRRNRRSNVMRAGQPAWRGCACNAVAHAVQTVWAASVYSARSHAAPSSGRGCPIHVDVSVGSYGRPPDRAQTALRGTRKGPCGGWQSAEVAGGRHREGRAAHPSSFADAPRWRGEDGGVVCQRRAVSGPGCLFAEPL